MHACVLRLKISHWGFKGQKVDCNCDRAGSAKTKDFYAWGAVIGSQGSLLYLKISNKEKKSHSAEVKN